MNRVLKEDAIFGHSYPFVFVSVGESFLRKRHGLGLVPIDTAGRHG